jgi:hypothetical protein
VAVAVAVVAAIVPSTITLLPGSGASQQIRSASPSKNGGAPPPTPATLPNAAAAAKNEPAPQAEPGDFVYIERKTTARNVNGSPGNLNIYTGHYHRMIWRSVDGSAAGLYRTYGTATGLDHPLPQHGTPAQSVSGKWRHWALSPVTGKPSLGSRGQWTYAYLKSLPHNPDKLLGKLRHSCRAPQNSKTCNFYIFETVTGLLTKCLVPRGLSAALAEAMAKIPGVQVQKNVTLPSTDKSGIAITQTQDGLRNYLIFDPHTFKLLGTKEIAAKAQRAMTPRDNGSCPCSGKVISKAGTVMNSTVIVDTAIVHKKGQQP